MRDRLELEPQPTPVEFEAVVAALAEAPLEEAGSARGSAWRQAGVEESVDRALQALWPRSSRGAPRA